MPHQGAGVTIARTLVESPRPHPERLVWLSMDKYEEHTVELDEEAYKHMTAADAVQHMGRRYIQVWTIEAEGITTR